MACFYKIPATSNKIGSSKRRITQNPLKKLKFPPNQRKQLKPPDKPSFNFILSHFRSCSTKTKCPNPWPSQIDAKQQKTTTNLTCGFLVQKRGRKKGNCEIFC
jgi:hypothetical protein